MIRSTRRTLVHLLAGAAALALLPAQPARAAEAKPRVALVMKSLANEFFQTMQDGAKADQKTHAAQYILISNGIKDETDTAAQIKIVQQMLVEHVGAIVIAPADSKALVPVLAEAAAKGVIVVNIDNKLDADALKEKNLVVPFVGPDNRKGAKLAGDFLGKQLKAGDKVGILEGVSTTVNAQQRTAGFQDAMKAVGATVAGVQSGQWEMDKANAVAAAMLREHPDLRALLAGNDNMAIGAVAAIKSAGKTGKVLVVGYDNISALKPMLADGRVLATVDQYGAKQAVFGIQTALQAIKDKKAQKDLAPLVETQVSLVTK
jgi:ribose transport system substrate-binding protein